MKYLGKRLMTWALRFSKRHGMYHSWPMFFYMAGYLAWFGIIEHIPRRFYLQILLRIDRFIPLVEVFVIPYVSWFFFIVIQMYSFYRKDRNAYDEACTFLMTGMTAFLVISTLLPNRQPLRLVDLPRENVLTTLIANLWRTDTPTNVFPSIHVFNSIAVELPLLRSDHAYYHRPLVRYGTLVWSVLIILSTLFIRQHSMFDVVTAVLLAAICSYIVYRRGNVFRFEKWDAFALRLENSV